MDDKQAKADYDEAMLRFFGIGPDGWAQGKIVDFHEHGYSKNERQGVVVEKIRARDSFSHVIYGAEDLCYEDAKVGDRVKVKTRTLRSDETHPDLLVYTIRVTEVTDTQVIGTYVNSEYDEKFLGKKFVEELQGDRESFKVEHIEPKPVVGELLHVVRKTEIVLVERVSDASNSGSTDTSE